MNASIRPIIIPVCHGLRSIKQVGCRRAIKNSGSGCEEETISWFKQRSITVQINVIGEIHLSTIKVVSKSDSALIIPQLISFLIADWIYLIVLQTMPAETKLHI